LKVVKKFPYVTVTLVAASYAFYFLAGQYLTTWGFLSTDTGLVLRLLLHPILHGDLFQLLGNTVFLLAGGLVESWMMFRRKIRYAMLILCYLVSLDVDYLGWVALTPGHVPPVGLSGMIFAALALGLIYCVVFRTYLRFRGRNLLALASIVLLLVLHVVNTVGNLAGEYGSEYLYPAEYHVLVFFQAMILGYLLFRRLRREATAQRNTERTEPTKHALRL
jgi:membrane associated rhomboid family serine protease